MEKSPFRRRIRHHASHRNGISAALLIDRSGSFATGTERCARCDHPFVSATDAKQWFVLCSGCAASTHRTVLIAAVALASVFGLALFGL